MQSIFVSFKYVDDNSRVQQILNAGVVEGQPILKANEWETVKRQGDAAIRNWIDKQLNYKKCVVVMIGQNTHTSRWVKYEIEKAFSMGKPVIGVHIHNLKDFAGNQSQKGRLPSTVYDAKIRTYDSPYSDSKWTYDYIKNNIDKWISTAIASNSFSRMF